MSTVLYPGSFDPFHLGHLDVVEQAAQLFGEVVVAVMHNPDKPDGAFGVDARVRVAELSCAGSSSVSVRAFPGLAVDAAASVGASFIVKGLRTAGDFEVEQQMAHTNFAVAGVRTVYLPCRPAYGFISSRFIRDIARHGGDIAPMVAPAAADQIASLLRTGSGQ